MRFTIAMGVGLVLATAVGCATGRFEELPESDQKVFLRCSKAIEPAKCGTVRDEVERVGCVREAKAEYAEESSGNSRHRWLAENGCPQSMMEP